MKDIRGAHVAAVRNAIFKTVGLTQLSSTRRKNSKDVMVWKSSKEVKAEYNNLYKDETLIENITAAAFPSLNDASDESFSMVTLRFPEGHFPEYTIFRSQYPECQYPE